VRKGVVLFVSSGMIRPKKRDHQLARLHLYLNYGLLGLASQIARQGHEAIVFMGDFARPDEMAADIASRGFLPSSYPLFISLPSYFSVGWAREFCAKLRELQSDLKIVVGGRWVVGTDGSWVRGRIPEVDLVVYGTADDRIAALLSPDRWGQVGGTDLAGPGPPESSGGPFPRLAYKLLDGFDRYHPSIEVSRGCGKGCNFCVERAISRTPPRSPQDILEAVSDCYDVYETRDLRFYFEASMLSPGHVWARDLGSLFCRNEMAPKWRCETRADAVSPRALEALAESGLQVVDVGLESASPRQLTRMGKAGNPSAYLKAASRFLHGCRDLGIWAKVNVLLYPGEDEGSVRETREWLDEHRDCIKGISANPLVVYGSGEEGRSHLAYVSSLGAGAVSPMSLEENGYAELNLSRSMDRDQAEYWCLAICREFMDERDYYDLKSFAYFPRRLSYEDFRAISVKEDPDLLPFGQTTL